MTNVSYMERCLSDYCPNCESVRMPSGVDANGGRCYECNGEVMEAPWNAEKTEGPLYYPPGNPLRDSARCSNCDRPVTSNADTGWEITYADDNLCTDCGGQYTPGLD